MNDACVVGPDRHGRRAVRIRGAQRARREGRARDGDCPQDRHGVGVVRADRRCATSYGLGRRRPTAAGRDARQADTDKNNETRHAPTTPLSRLLAAVTAVAEERFQGMRITANQRPAARCARTKSKSSSHATVTRGASSLRLRWSRCPARIPSARETMPNGSCEAQEAMCSQETVGWGFLVRLLRNHRATRRGHDHRLTREPRRGSVGSKTALALTAGFGPPFSRWKTYADKVRITRALDREPMGSARSRRPSVPAVHRGSPLDDPLVGRAGRRRMKLPRRSPVVVLVSSRVTSGPYKC
jgi:hypothetical protein